MAKLDNTVSTKVADTTLERIETYADDHGMSRSEAVRNRLRTGLDAADAGPGAHVSYGALAGIFGLILVSAQYATADGLLGPIGVALVAAGLLHDLAHRFGFTTYLPF